MWKDDGNFSVAIEVLLEDEGGFANYTSDRGQMTYMGVSERYFPKWEGWKVIYKHLENFPELKEAYSKAPKSVTQLDEILFNDIELQDSVRDFYYTFFWIPMRLDKITCYEKTLLIFTAGVLSGKNTAAKYQQICSGSVVDKIVGPNTIKNTNETHDKQFCFQFLLEMQEYYTYITNNNKDNRKFFLGWSNRNMNLYKKTLKSFNQEMPIGP